MSRNPDISSRSGNLSPELALLGFLLGGQQHGYDLHRQFNTDLGQVWHLSQSQAYAILKRLEKRGDIAAHTVKQAKLPPRQVLRITPAGRRRFRQWLELGTSANARAIRLEFLTRLYFARRYAPEKTAGIYAAQRAEVRAHIERLEQALAEVPAKQTFNRLSLDLRVRQMKLILRWIEEIGRELVEPEEPRP